MKTEAMLDLLDSEEERIFSSSNSYDDMSRRCTAGCDSLERMVSTHLRKQNNFCNIEFYLATVRKAMLHLAAYDRDSEMFRKKIYEALVHATAAKKTQQCLYKLLVRHNNLLLTLSRASNVDEANNSSSSSTLTQSGSTWSDRDSEIFTSNLLCLPRTGKRLRSPSPEVREVVEEVAEEVPADEVVPEVATPPGDLSHMERDMYSDMMRSYGSSVVVEAPIEPAVESPVGPPPRKRRCYVTSQRQDEDMFNMRQKKYLRPKAVPTLNLPKKVCRTCTTTIEINLWYKFETVIHIQQGITPTLKEALNYCGIQINKMTLSNTVVCQNCIDKVRGCYLFKLYMVLNIGRRAATSNAPQNAARDNACFTCNASVWSDFRVIEPKTPMASCLKQILKSIPEYIPEPNEHSPVVCKQCHYELTKLLDFKKEIKNIECSLKQQIEVTVGRCSDNLLEEVARIRKHPYTIVRPASEHRVVQPIKISRTNVINNDNVATTPAPASDDEQDLDKNDVPSSSDINAVEHEKQYKPRDSVIMAPMPVLTRAVEIEIPVVPSAVHVEVVQPSKKSRKSVAIEQNVDRCDAPSSSEIKAVKSTKSKASNRRNDNRVAISCVKKSASADVRVVQPIIKKSKVVTESVTAETNGNYGVSSSTDVVDDDINIACSSLPCSDEMESLAKSFGLPSDITLETVGPVKMSNASDSVCVSSGLGSPGSVNMESRGGEVPRPSVCNTSISHPPTLLPLKTDPKHRSAWSLNEKQTLFKAIKQHYKQSPYGFSVNWPQVVAKCRDKVQFENEIQLRYLWCRMMKNAKTMPDFKRTEMGKQILTFLEENDKPISNEIIETIVIDNTTDCDSSSQTSGKRKPQEVQTQPTLSLNKSSSINARPSGISQISQSTTLPPKLSTDTTDLSSKNPNKTAMISQAPTSPSLRNTISDISHKSSSNNRQTKTDSSTKKARPLDISPAPKSTFTASSAKKATKRLSVSQSIQSSVSPAKKPKITPNLAKPILPDSLPKSQASIQGNSSGKMAKTDGKTDLSQSLQPISSSNKNNSSTSAEKSLPVSQSKNLSNKTNVSDDVNVEEKDNVQKKSNSSDMPMIKKSIGNKIKTNEAAQKQKHRDEKDETQKKRNPSNVNFDLKNSNKTVKFDENTNIVKISIPSLAPIKNGTSKEPSSTININNSNDIQGKEKLDENEENRNSDMKATIKVIESSIEDSNKDKSELAKNRDNDRLDTVNTKTTPNASGIETNKPKDKSNVTDEEFLAEMTDCLRSLQKYENVVDQNGKTKRNDGKIIDQNKYIQTQDAKSIASKEKSDQEAKTAAQEKKTVDENTNIPRDKPTKVNQDTEDSDIQDNTKKLESCFEDEKQLSAVIISNVLDDKAVDQNGNTTAQESNTTAAQEKKIVNEKTNIPSDAPKEEQATKDSAFFQDNTKKLESCFDDEKHSYMSVEDVIQAFKINIVDYSFNAKLLNKEKDVAPLKKEEAKEDVKYHVDDGVIIIDDDEPEV